MDMEKAKNRHKGKVAEKASCPECEETIEYLISAEEIIEYIEYYEFNGECYEFLNSKPLAGKEVKEYRCPHCNAILAYDERQAKKILKKEEK